MSVTETTYFDSPLNPGTTYYYSVTAVNAAGISSNALLTGGTVPNPPASLSATPADSQVTLSWPAVSGATSYVIERGNSPGNESTIVVSGYTGTTYTNTGLADGTTYYYVVAATDAAGTGPNSTEASATPGANIFVGARNLVWKGDGSANQWNVSGSPNWLSNNVATTFNNGDSATFSDVGSNNVAVSLAGTLQPALLTVASTKNYTFSGTGFIAGTNLLLKGGTSTLTVNTTNTFSGGTIISNGTVVPGSAAANLAALGSGSITFYGGELQFNGVTGSSSPDYLGNTNSLIVPLGSTATIFVPQRFLTPGLNGSLSGSGTLDLYVTYVRGDISGNWANFYGQLNVLTTGSGDFRVANANGFPNAKLYVGPNVFMYSRANNGATVPIGEFAAAVGVGVAAGGGSSLGTQSAVTWRVGGLNTDTTNAASFQGTTALIKEGTGTWTLTGTNTHIGATTLNNGTLLINGSFNGSPVTVSGGTLGGGGVISGAPVAVNSGGTFAPGSPFGTLTVSNNLTLAGGSTASFLVQHSPLMNSAVKVSGTLFAGGTLSVTDAGSGTLDNGDSFQLITAGNASGGFTNLILPPLTGSLVWNTNTLNTSGTISVVTLTSPTIGNLQIAAGNLTISGTGGVNSWPYVVFSSTNLTAGPWIPIAASQCDYAGNFSLVLTNVFNSGQPQTFYKLQLQ
jgi:autotransporter-associated beta strand protein